MKVLFQSIDGLSWGGSGHQLVMMMESLKDLGHVTSYSAEANFENYDVVIINHLNFKSAIDYTTCDKPMIIKCIWQGSGPRVDNSRTAFLARKAFRLVVESNLEMEAMLAFLKSELSQEEMTAVRSKTVIFKPGIDPKFTNAKPLSQRSQVHVNGWYCHNKSQAEVIKACLALRLPVTTAGATANEGYVKYCKSFNYGTVLGDLGKEELNKVYNDSRVYVTASIQENHSASMCEAIACGCRIVSSSTHLANPEYTKSGFKIYKCGDFDDLKSKILEAYNSNDEQNNDIWTKERLAKEYDKLFRKLTIKWWF